MALAVLPVNVFAHAVLVGSDPPAGAVLAAPPARVTVTFSEAVTAAGPGLAVLSPAGRAATRGPVRVRGDQISVAVGAAAAGTYLVRWQVISADTHPSAGEQTFSVGHPSAVPTPGLPSVGAQDPVGLLLESFGRWLHLAGLALGFGTIAFRVLLLPDAEERTDRRLDRLATAGAALLVLAEPVALMGAAAALGTGPGEVLDSPFGRVLAVRGAGALLFWAALATIREEGGRGRVALLGLGAALTLADGLGNHVIAGPPALLTIGLGAVHEAAMAVWAGGVVAWLAMGGGVLGFGRVAGIAFAVLVVSGAALAVGNVRSPVHLLDTGYGAVLVLKVVAVGATAVIAALGSRRLEAWALAGVVAVAALLANLPPPA